MRSLSLLIVTAVMALHVVHQAPLAAHAAHAAHADGGAYAVSSHADDRGEPRQSVSRGTAPHSIAFSGGWAALSDQCAIAPAARPSTAASFANLDFYAAGHAISPLLPAGFASIRDDRLPRSMHGVFLV